MVLLSYYLSVYMVPDSALNKMTQSARKLLWGNSSNRSCMPMVNLNVTMLDKPKGDFGIRNLRLAKYVLKSKNVSNLLNNTD